MFLRRLTLHGGFHEVVHTERERRARERPKTRRRRHGSRVGKSIFVFFSLPGGPPERKLIHGAPGLFLKRQSLQIVGAAACNESMHHNVYPPTYGILEHLATALIVILLV